VERYQKNSSNKFYNKQELHKYLVNWLMN